METEDHNSPMTTSRLEEDEPESDDQGQMWSTTPLNSKPIWKAEEIDFSENTGMTSPCSSSKTQSSNDSSRGFSISFNDNHNVREVDCDYTDEQVETLWFTKDEYDDFLQACDDDAQKCEAYEKETRVNKLKKEIRRQRRQRAKEHKEDKRLQRFRNADSLDESMNSQANFEKETQFSDDSEDDESDNVALDYNEDEEGWMCSLGLEAWTLEGYKAREHHRQKAIDSVLNEQYAAWDRGMVENMEMMSALYFAASAITKHEAHKKALQLEQDVQEHTVVSTLEDYNKAVQTLNVLQKSLSCIQIKNKENESRKQQARPLAKRRGSTGSTAVAGAGVATRRGSTGGMGSAPPSHGAATSIIDRALSITEKPLDQAPQLPVKSKSSHPPQTSSSSSSRKKFKQRNESGAPNVYKSKAATDILFSPPTPPVTKKQPVVYKPSQGGRPNDLTGGAPLTNGSEGRFSPKNRKIMYKPVVGAPKYDDSRRSRSIGTTTTTTTATKKKKKKKRDPLKPKKHQSEVVDPRPRSKSPRPRELGTERHRSKSPRPRELGSERHRSKSPRPRELGSERHRSKSPRPRDIVAERPRSKSPRANHLRCKSPRQKAMSSKENSGTDKLFKKTSSTSKSPKTPTKNVRVAVSVSTSPRNSSKKEHWWFQQQRQTCQ